MRFFGPPCRYFSTLGQVRRSLSLIGQSSQSHDKNTPFSRIRTHVIQGDKNLCGCMLMHDVFYLFVNFFVLKRSVQLSISTQTYLCNFFLSDCCILRVFSRVALYKASVSGLCHGTFAWTICRSVRLSAVYCGKTAEWIRMPFGMVNGVGRGWVC